jgi:hemolysin activation/secretion protein
MPFSFSPGDVDGRAQGSAVIAGIEWTRRMPTRAWAARATLQIGVDALDATTHSIEPDSEFVAFLGQLEFAATLTGGRRLLARTVVQIADDPLLAMYKLPVGGRHSVRGYGENQFVRDNAVVAQLEYQLPLVVDDAGRPRANLQLALFADYGASWDEQDTFATSGTEAIASVGLGLLWDPIPAFHFELYWGEAVNEVQHVSSSLQDRGVHYQASFHKAF